jgi:hypothetical protein
VSGESPRIAAHTLGPALQTSAVPRVASGRSGAQSRIDSVATARINERQRALLERIADGTEPVTSAEYALATTVYALRSRKLVRTVRRSGGWIAEVTDDGRYFLEHGHRRPADEAPRPSARPTSAAQPAPLPEIDPAELMARLTEAGGTLTIAEPDHPTRAMWRAAARRAIDGGLVPPGSALHHSGRSYGDLVLRLEASAEPPRTPRYPPICVPERLVKPHPVVAALRAAPGPLQVSRLHQQRALRLLEALFREAERRGYKVSLADKRRDCVTVVAVDGHSYPVKTKELTDRSPHVPTATELAEKARSEWTRIPEYDYTPNGRLQIALEQYWHSEEGRRHRTTWSDGQGSRLDDKLPEVLAEIEARAAEDERRRLEWARQQDVQRDRKREAIRWAYAQLVEHHRATELSEQVGAWIKASNIRRFCVAVRATHGGDRVPTAAELEWLAWAESYADRLDPTKHPVVGPEDPEPEYPSLRPFLGGWYNDSLEVGPLRSVLGLDDAPST